MTSSSKSNYDEMVLERPWKVVENDLIGGWAIVAVEEYQKKKIKYLSQAFVISNGNDHGSKWVKPDIIPYVGEFMTLAAAEHVVNLHNQLLV